MRGWELCMNGGRSVTTRLTFGRYPLTDKRSEVLSVKQQGSALYKSDTYSMGEWGDNTYMGD